MSSIGTWWGYFAYTVKCFLWDYLELKRFWLHKFQALFRFIFSTEKDYPPVARAGNDVVIVLPVDHVVLYGNGSTDDKVQKGLILVGFAARTSTFFSASKSLLALVTSGFAMIGRANMVASVNRWARTSDFVWLGNTRKNQYNTTSYSHASSIYHFAMVGEALVITSAMQLLVHVPQFCTLSSTWFLVEWWNFSNTNFLFIIRLLRSFYSVNTCKSFYVKHFVAIHFQGIVSYEWSKTPSSPAVGDMQVSITGLTGLTRGTSWEVGSYRWPWGSAFLFVKLLKMTSFFRAQVPLFWRCPTWLWGTTRFCWKWQIQEDRLPAPVSPS